MKKYIIPCIMALFLVLPVNYANARDTDDEKLANIVSSLVQYIKWRERDYKNITFCSIGLDSVGSSVRRMKIANFTVKINPNDTDLPSCHVLYISESEVKHASEILWKIKEYQIVTISLINGFAKMGGGIQLVMEVDKLVFRINLTTAKKANVIIKSDLLAMAETVE